MTLPSVWVRAPATSANLGPGFDCLGLALDLWNEAELVPSDLATRVRIRGYGEDSLPQGADNRIIAGVKKVFDACKEAPPRGFRLECANNIPPGAGLGSSAAAILAGLLAGNAMLGGPLAEQQILEIAASEEGHPDNAAAALLGGLVITTSTAAGPVARKIPVGSLQVAVITPDFEFYTHQARAALPGTVPFADAAFNLARTALTVEALRSEDYDLLALAMQDRLHQPYRLARIPGAELAMRAALDAGAASVALSGAGPSLIAFGPAPLDPVCRAMESAFRSAGLASRTSILGVVQHGAEASAGARPKSPSPE